MKKRSMITLTLALVLTLSLMAGCTGKPSDEDTSSVTPPVSSEETADSEGEQKVAVSGQLTTVYETMLEEVYGEEKPSFVLNEDTTMIKDMTGMEFASDAVADYIYAMPMINNQFQIFVGVEATKGNVAEIETMLTAYQAQVLKAQIEFPYVDFRVEKATAAQVITIDNYVFYVCIANPEFGDGEEVTQEHIDTAIEKSVASVKEAIKY